MRESALEKENSKGQQCLVCGKRKLSVSERENSYAREIAGDADATHTVCDECDYQNKMDV